MSRLKLQLSNSENAIIDGGTGVGTIVNDDGVPSIAISDKTIAEGAIATFDVVLSNPSTLPVTIAYATSNGIANKSDFVGKSGILTFEPGMLRRTISIRTIEDDLDEIDEVFNVNLSQPINTFIATGTGRGTISDNDPSVSLFLKERNLNEAQSGTTNFVFDIILSRASGRDIHVNYATLDGTAKVADGDYQAVTGTVHFAPGQLVQSIAVPVLGDAVNESNEVFYVQLSNAQGVTIADGLAKGTILNDDALLFGINDATIVEGDSGTASLTFTVTLSTPSSQTVSVNYATADGVAALSDNDYQTQAGTLTFAPGETQKSVSIQVTGDLRNEANEMLLVNLLNAVGGSIADSQGQGTIQNDDPLPSLSIGDVSVPEMDYNTGTINLYVQLSAPSGQTVKVDYRTENGTATSTSNIKDYIDTFGTLTFLPGQTVQSFQVSVVGDLRLELDETVRVLLTNPVNTTISDDLAILTIKNDDVAMVTITGASIKEGNSGFAIASVDVSLSNPSDSRITIDFNSANGTATPVVDYVSRTGTLVFEPGEMNKKIEFQIIGDTLDEADEDFEVILSNGTGGVFLPSYSETDVIILDDDPSGSRSILPPKRVGYTNLNLLPSAYMAFDAYFAGLETGGFPSSIKRARFGRF